jgi:hypothetical protein
MSIQAAPALNWTGWALLSFFTALGFFSVVKECLKMSPFLCSSWAHPSRERKTPANKSSRVAVANDCLIGFAEQ